MPLYRAASIRWHFHPLKNQQILLEQFHDLHALANSNYNIWIRVLLNSVTYIVSVWSKSTTTV